MLGTEVDNPVTTYLRTSTAPYNIQRLVCRELQQEHGLRPSTLSGVRLEDRVHHFKNLTGKLNERLRDFENGRKWIETAKFAGKLTVTGVTGYLVTMASGGILAPLVMTTWAAGHEALGDAIFDKWQDDHRAEFREDVKSILRAALAQKKVTKAQIREWKATLSDKELYSAMLDVDTLFSPGGVLEATSEEMQAEMLCELTNAIDENYEDPSAIMDAPDEEVPAKAERFKTASRRVVEQHDKRREEADRLCDMTAGIKAQFEAVTGKLKQLGTQVKANGEGIKANARSLAAMQSIMFEGMPPKMQILALRAGFFKGIEGIDTAKLEEEAVAAVKKQELIEAFDNCAKGAALAGGLADLLGLDPNLQKAIGTVGTGFRIASQIADNNLFGAVMTVFGFFKKDPAQQRHEQVMAALSKLAKGQKTIIANQRALGERQIRIMERQSQIFEAIRGVGELIERSHKQMIDLVQIVGKDVLINRALIASVSRKGLQDARVFCIRRNDPEYGGCKRYANLALHYRHYRKQFQSFWEECNRVFTSSRVQPNIAITNPHSPQRLGQTQSFREKIVAPSLHFFNLIHRPEDRGRAVAALMFPSRCTSHLPGKLLEMRFKDGTPPPDVTFALASLSDLVNPDLVIEYGEMILELQGYFALMEAGEKQLLPFEQVHKDRPINPKGKGILPHYLRHLNLTIVQQALISGDGGIMPALYYFLQDPVRTDPFAPPTRTGPYLGLDQAPLVRQAALEALRHNQLLRGNFVLYLTKQIFSQEDGPNLANYKLAYELTTIVAERAPDFGQGMQNLFGSSWTVIRNEDRWELVLDDDIKIALPHPVRLEQEMDLISQTADLPQLLGMRRAVSQALFDYDYADWAKTLEPEERRHMRGLIEYSAKTTTGDSP